jgi:hypothetical protein
VYREANDFVHRPKSHIHKSPHSHTAVTQTTETFRQTPNLFDHLLLLSRFLRLLGIVNHLGHLRSLFPIVLRLGGQGCRPAAKRRHHVGGNQDAGRVAEGVVGGAARPAAARTTDAAKAGSADGVADHNLALGDADAGPSRWARGAAARTVIIGTRGTAARTVIIGTRGTAARTVIIGA